MGDKKSFEIKPKQLVEKIFTFDWWIYCFIHLFSKIYLAPIICQILYVHWGFNKKMCLVKKTIMSVSVLSTIIEVCTKWHKIQRRGNNIVWGLWDWSWTIMRIFLCEGNGQWGFEGDIPGGRNILGKWQVYGRAQWNHKAIGNMEFFHRFFTSNWPTL